MINSLNQRLNIKTEKSKKNSLELLERLACKDFQSNLVTCNKL